MLAERVKLLELQNTEFAEKAARDKVLKPYQVELLKLHIYREDNILSMTSPGVNQIFCNASGGQRWKNWFPNWKQFAYTALMLK